MKHPLYCPKCSKDEPYAVEEGENGLEIDGINVRNTVLVVAKMLKANGWKKRKAKLLELGKQI